MQIAGVTCNGLGEPAIQQLAIGSYRQAYPILRFDAVSDGVGIDRPGTPFPGSGETGQRPAARSPSRNFSD
jgi:hypothetical protein